ncbi:MAG: ABC transporter ATP-binding protein [Geminicoccaceae bacterium]
MSLQLREIGKIVQGEVHLEDIELDLQPGRLHVLLGPTAAGKTSLMRILAGLDRPSQGRVIVDGQDVTRAGIRSRDVAMVYQQFVNYPAFTVFENIAAPLRMGGMSENLIRTNVERMAGLLHIEPYLQRLPSELSGGQQQRCAIARALVRESGLLLLDEPLVNLDYKLREELREELQLLFENRSSIVVYSTADPHEALVMGGDVIVMDRGRILQTGPAAKVYRRPRSQAVARVFSDPPMNIVDVLAENGVARTGSGLEIPLPEHLADPTPMRITLGIRARHLSLEPAGTAGESGSLEPELPADASQSIAVEGEVELSEISGSETFIHVAHGRHSWVVQKPGVHDYGMGSKVILRIDPKKIFVFGETGALEAGPEAEDED